MVIAKIVLVWLGIVAVAALIDRWVVTRGR